MLYLHGYQILMEKIISLIPQHRSFPWNWSNRLRGYLEEDNWCPETAIISWIFSDRTSNDWLHICFVENSTNDTKAFGETLMNIVYHQLMRKVCYQDLELGSILNTCKIMKDFIAVY